MTRNLLCELCWSPMPSPRMRDGLVTCATCDPSDPPRPHRLPRHRPGRSKLGPRSSSTPTKHLTRELLASHAALLDPEDFAALDERPKTWGECCESTGPCPWVSCRHHLYLDVNPETGSLKLNFPDLEPEELESPCALRLASTGAQTLEEVGLRMNLTRERVRQLAVIALLKLKRAGAGL